MHILKKNSNMKRVLLGIQHVTSCVDSNSNIVYCANLVSISFLFKPITHLLIITRIISNSLACYLCNSRIYTLLPMSLYVLPFSAFMLYASAILILKKQNVSCLCALGHVVLFFLGYILYHSLLVG